MIISTLVAPMFPAIAASFEPVITGLFASLIGIQNLPGSIAIIG